MDTTIQCPNCRKSLKVPERLIGKTVRCPNCKNTFATESEEEDAGFDVVDDEPEVVKPRKSKPNLLLPPPPKTGKADDFEDDDDSQGSADVATRKRRRRSRARQRVQAPAVAMMVLGAVWLLLNLAQVVYLAISPPTTVGVRGQPVDASAHRVGVMVGGCFLFMWPIIPLLGGYKMKAMENYSSVMVACFACFFPCGFGCFGGIPIGIWALVVLNDPDVRKSFVS